MKLKFLCSLTSLRDFEVGLKYFETSASLAPVTSLDSWIMYPSTGGRAVAIPVPDGIT